ncbi:hypothetical protein C8R45DRAFT_1106169 [Mycena sanguinolenta]|nr:hypothetical protein C8R45DRAFT_1106169 [Mycena sanguinolenta]
MRFLWDTFYRTMQSFGLVVLETSPTTQSLTEHIQNLVHELRSRQINIGLSPDTVLLAHENPPLAPLYVVNRGLPRPSDNEIRLRRAPVRPSATLGELAANRLQFAVPGLCMVPHDGLNYLVLHFVIRQPDLTALFSLPGQPARHHRCLSQQIYTMFPRDRVHENWTHADGDSSCGESDDNIELNGNDTDDDEFENLPPNPTPGLASTRVLRNTQSRSHAPLPSPTSPSVPSLPLVLWDEPWQPRNRNVRSTTFDSNGVYQAAMSGTPSNIVVYRGESVSEAADELLKAVGLCVDSGDFTSVLSDDQSAIIHAPGSRVTVSSGEGILREVYHIALQKTMESGQQWLTPRADGKLSLLSVRSAGFGPHTFGPRQRMIGIAGAMWALVMIRGLAVDPVDIALLQFLFNDCDLNSLHPAFIAEWHPAVKAVCDAWKRAGPTGSVLTPLIASHVGTYLGIETSSLADRDQATHDGLLVEMFYKSMIASEGPSHTDVIALARNFRLPCRNGFTFTRYIQGFVGGSENFLANIMTSVVGPLTLITRLSFRPNEALSAPIAAAMGGDSLADILGDYFVGSGIPCPTLFAEARAHFPDIVDLSLVDTPNFRSHIWTWAVSGAPFLAQDTGDISASHLLWVVLVDDRDILYLGGKPESLRPSLLESGTISFRTCFLEARIPASFLLRAAQATYTSPEPCSRRHYIHHWLLCQSLNGILQHTIG